MGRRDWLERLSELEHRDGELPFSMAEHAVNRSWPLHGHEFYEIEFILSGGGVQILNGVRAPLAGGCLYAVTPADVHEIRVDPGAELRLVNLQFPEELIDEEVLVRLRAERRPLFAPLAGEALAAASAEIRRLRDEYGARRACWMTAIRATLHRLLIELLRASEAGDAAAADRELDRQPDQFVMKLALQFIHRHYRERLPLGQAAEHVRLSPNYFSEKFHRWVGKPFRQYVLELRLDYADKLLRSSAIPVTEIAHSAGFGSLAYFIRMYKLQYGMTPNAARKGAGTMPAARK